MPTLTMRVLALIMMIMTNMMMRATMPAALKLDRRADDTDADDALTIMTMTMMMIVNHDDDGADYGDGP